MIARPIINGKELETGKTEKIINPYTREEIGISHLVDKESVENVCDRVDKAFKCKLIELPTYKKLDILRNLLRLVKDNKEQLARLIALEVAKPIGLARLEVERGILNIESALGLLYSIRGELMPLDYSSLSQGRWGMTRRFSIGPLLCITPFNFPLNLLLHKVLPAIISDTPFVVKPPPNGRYVQYLFSRLLIESGYPEEGVFYIPCSNEVAEMMVRDDRFRLLSFTGSSKVGWYLKSISGKKKVILELGGNAFVIVDTRENLEDTVRKIVRGGYSYAGQICISVQRVIVRREIYREFEECIVEEVRKLEITDPFDERGIMSCVISESEAERLENWIRRAKEKGSIELLGHIKERDGNRVYPSIFKNIDRELEIWCEEAFGPLICLREYSSIDEAIEIANDSRYGLQGGIFTDSIKTLLKVFQNVQVGALIHNDVPTFRIDPMPYGGTKDSGMGREGVYYAYLEYTEPRLLVSC